MLEYSDFFQKYNNIFLQDYNYINTEYITSRLSTQTLEFFQGNEDFFLLHPELNYIAISHLRSGILNRSETHVIYFLGEDYLLEPSPFQFFQDYSYVFENFYLFRDFLLQDCIGNKIGNYMMIKRAQCDWLQYYINICFEIFKQVFESNQFQNYFRQIQFKIKIVYGEYQGNMVLIKDTNV